MYMLCPSMYTKGDRTIRVNGLKWLASQVGSSVKEERTPSRLGESTSTVLLGIAIRERASGKMLLFPGLY